MLPVIIPKPADLLTTDDVQELQTAVLGGGIDAANLLALYGAGGVPFTPSGAGAIDTTVKAAIRYLYGHVNVMRYMTDAQINAAQAKTMPPPDVTLAIDMALAEADLNHALIYFPTAWYLTQGGHVFGNCRGFIGDNFDSSQLFLATGVANTVDVFTQIPTSVNPDEGLMFNELSILPQAGKPGRYGLNLTAGAAPGVHRSMINRLRVQGLGNYAIRNGSADSGVLQNCVLHGLAFDKGTDTQNVLNNTIVGIYPLHIVYIDCVAGSNCFNVKGNALISGWSGVYVKNAGTIAVDDNQFESQALAGTIPGTNAMINFVGADAVITAPSAKGNRMGATANQGTSVNIALDNTVNADIGPNVYDLSNEAPTVFAVTTTPRSFGTKIHPGLFSTTTSDGQTAFRSSAQHLRQYDTVYNTSGQYMDRGVGTKGVWKRMTPYQPRETCTATATAPGVISVGTNPFVAGNPVAFYSTGTLPAPLTVATTYYVKNVAGTSPYTFELAYYQGGPSIALTSAGTGTVSCWTPRAGTASAAVQNPNSAPIAVKIDPDSDMAKLRGSVKVLNIASNMIVGFIPYGYWPLDAYQVLAGTLRDTVSGLYYGTSIQIGSDGVITLRGVPAGPGATAVEVYFDGIEYPVLY